MGTGYTRQSLSEIQDGETIFSGDLNDEFNLLEDFASGTVGHSHDGTTGEGPKINLATSVTDKLPIANGGTNATTEVGGSDNLSTIATDIASAATTDLSTATGVNVTITGTTTITSFGNAPAGAKRWITFAGVLTLTYNATSLILPGAGNITTAAGDTCVALSLGSGNWRVVSYSPISGQSVSTSSPTDLLNAIKTVDGDGSGLDSDLLDGQHGTYYLARANHTGTQSADTITDGTTNKAYTATEKTKLAGIEAGATGDQTPYEILAAITTVDGSGSGLDSDLLDGQHGSYYQNASNINAGTIASARLPTGVLPTSASSSNSTDFNTLVTPGWQPLVYLGTGPNGPGDANYYWVQNLLYASAAQNITQLAFHYATPGYNIWIRGRYDNTWTAWKKIAIDGDYVPRTGGTFVGPVTVDGGKLLTLNGPTNDYAAQFNSNSAVWGAVIGYAKDTSVYGILGYGNARSFLGQGELYNDGEGIFTGRVTSSGSFLGNATAAILAPNGATGMSGTVYLRPKGYNETAGQAYVDSIGDFYTYNALRAGNTVYSGSAFLATNGNINGSVWGGYLSTYLDTYFARISNMSSYVASYTAAMSAGAFGSYVFATVIPGTSRGALSFGETLSGSILRPSSVGDTGAIGYSVSSLSGSWRAMGANVVSFSDTYRLSTLFLRYA
jgi:hypothetical protein